MYTLASKGLYTGVSPPTTARRRSLRLNFFPTSFTQKFWKWLELKRTAHSLVSLVRSCPRVAFLQVRAEPGLFRIRTSRTPGSTTNCRIFNIKVLNPCLYACGCSDRVPWPCICAHDQLVIFSQCFEKLAREPAHHRGLGCNPLHGQWSVPHKPQPSKCYLQVHYPLLVLALHPFFFFHFSFSWMLRCSRSRSAEIFVRVG